jgi:hypothetical protein
VSCSDTCIAIWPSPIAKCDACGRRTTVSRPGLPAGWRAWRPHEHFSTLFCCPRGECVAQYMTAINQGLEKLDENELL